MSGEKTVAIIGAGAAGLAASVQALLASEKYGCKIRVILIEGLSRAGKKILATGNGRCNLSNEDLSEENYYGNTELVKSVLKKFNKDDTLSFFSEFGLFTKTDFAGRIYPLSNQASSVLDALRFAATSLGAEIITNTKVNCINEESDGYIINRSIYADRVIIAAGGCAQSIHGSDGSGFSLLEALGIELTPRFPSLVPLVVQNFTKGLKGIRAEGRITIKRSGKVLASDCGEIQYTDYGLSGIPAMQVSRPVSEHFALKMPGDIFAYVDRAPAIDENTLSEYITESILKRPLLPAEELLAGIMPKRLGITVLGEISVNPEKPLKTINAGTLPSFIKAVKNKKYTLSGVLGFSEAQVTAGGVAGNEINYNDMSLKKRRGIYVCGELVDVDGKCGGYNLQWAWSSGRLAGKCAAESLL